MAKVKKDETLEEYRRFYPDTTVTEMTVLDTDMIPPSADVLAMVKKLGMMTKSMPLYYRLERLGSKLPKPGGEIKSKYRIMVYKSREFLEVCDKMCHKGCKVKFFDPDAPETPFEGEIAADGIYYKGGSAMVRIESAEAGLTSENDSFAIWWRPVEE